MTNGTHIQYANIHSTRNEGVVISDNGGSHVEVMIWVGPSARFHPQPRMIERRWINKVFGALTGNKAERFAEMTERRAAA